MQKGKDNYIFEEFEKHICVSIRIRESLHFNNKNKFVRQVPIVELFNLLFVIKLNPISQFVTTIYLWPLIDYTSVPIQ